MKEQVLDPQGAAVLGALGALGYSSVQKVRIGKYIELRLKAKNRSEAEEKVHEMSDRLLSNPVIEDYTFSLDEVGEAQ